MKAGVGFASLASGLDSGKSAAAEAMKSGGVSAPELVLAFCGGEVDAEAFYDGVRAAVGPGAPILGGSAIGVITGHELSYQGKPGGVAVLDLGGSVRAISAVDGIDRGELDAGRRLGRSLSESQAGGDKPSSCSMTRSAWRRLR